MTKKNYRYYLYTLLCALTVRGSLFLSNVDYYIRTDDFGTLLYPAYLAGYDWTDYYSVLDYYYGYGYYWIFAPLFRLIENPKMIILTIALINTLFMALICVFVYRTLVKYLHFPKAAKTVFVSVMPILFEGDLLPLTGRSLVYRTDNEVPLFFIIWLLFGILVRALSHRNTHKAASLFYSLAAAVVLAWGQSVHERTLAIMIGLSAAVLLVALIKRVFILNPFVFFGTWLAGFFAARTIRARVIALIWSGEEVRNLTVGPDSVDFLKTWPGIKGCLVILLGNLHSLFVKSYGFICVAFIVVLGWIIVSVKNRKKERDSREELIDAGIFTFMVFGAAILVTLAGLSLRWGCLIYDGMVNDTVVFGYKGICYSRYFWGISGPIFIGMFIWIQNKNSLTKKMIGWSWAVFIAVEALFLRYIYPLCLRKLDDYNCVKRALNSWFFDVDHIKLNMAATFASTIFILLLLTLIMYAAGKDARQRQKLLFTTGMLVSAMLGIAYINNINTWNISFDFEDEIVGETINELRGITGKDPGQINVSVGYRPYQYVVPLYEKDIKLSSELPDQKDEEFLMITTTKRVESQKLFEKFNGYCAVIKEDILIFTNIKEYVEYLKTSNYKEYTLEQEN